MLVTFSGMSVEDFCSNIHTCHFVSVVNCVILVFLIFLFVLFVVIFFLPLVFVLYLYVCSECTALCVRFRNEISRKYSMQYLLKRLFDEEKLVKTIISQQAPVPKCRICKPIYTFVRTKYFRARCTFPNSFVSKGVYTNISVHTHKRKHV